MLTDLRGLADQVELAIAVEEMAALDLLLTAAERFAGTPAAADLQHLARDRRVHALKLRSLLTELMGAYDQIADASVKRIS